MMADIEEVLDTNNPIWVWIYLDTDQLDLAFEKLDAMPVIDPIMFSETPRLRKIQQDPRWPAIGERAGLWPDPRDEISFEIEVPETNDQSKL